MRSAIELIDNKVKDLPGILLEDVPQRLMCQERGRAGDLMGMNAHTIQRYLARLAHQASEER